LVHIIIVFVVVSGLGVSGIELNTTKNSWYRRVIFPCQCYSANAAYSYFINVPRPLRQLCNRWRR